MAITPERFAQGMTYEAYKQQMTRNKEQFLANEGRLVIDPEDLAAFKRLQQPMSVFVLAEDWCGDVVDNLPMLGRIAAESGTLNVRIFLRDQNLDLMDQYLNQGKYRSIPVFVFLDAKGEEVGRLTERPATVSERRAGFKTDFFARHAELGNADTPVDQLPEAVRVQYLQEMAQRREEWKSQDERDVVQMLRGIVERASA